MELHFTKWHGTGNDFILVDDRKGRFPWSDVDLIGRLCDRHFGIGSDGLILIQATPERGADFHMEFFNPDASRSFCGNGSRCAFAFWSLMNGRVGEARFTAIDGSHTGTWVGEDIAITLPPVLRIRSAIDGPQVDLIHTGSPHEVVWVDDVDAVEIQVEGPRRRHAGRHGAGGSNVNFVQPWDGGLRMRTFERGVESETLSCGSGVVAASLSAMNRGMVLAPVHVRTPGGQLRVEATSSNERRFEAIRLIGPATAVFRGILDI